MKSDVAIARRLLWLIPTSAVACVLGVRLVVTSEPVRREFAAYVASQLATRSRSAVQVSGVTFGLGLQPCFHDLEIYRFHGPFKVKAATRQACVERWASAVGSGFHAIRVRLHQPRIEFEGSHEGASTKRAFVDVKPAVSGTTAKEDMRALREIEVVFDELLLDWNEMPFPERLASGSFGPIDGVVTVQMRGQASALSLAIREPKTGSSIRGRVTPTAEGWDLSAGLEGDLVPIFGSLLSTSELDIRKIETRGTVGMNYATRARTLTVDVDLEQQDVDLAASLVSKNRLVGFAAREKARISVDLGRSVLAVRDGLVEINGIPIIFSLELAPGTTSPAFSASADLRTTPLARLLKSVPGAAPPAIAENIRDSVQFALSSSMRGELRDPSTWQPRIEHQIVGIGPHAEGSGLEFLNETFQYYPLTGNGRSKVGRLIGPDSASWQPYSKIPYIQRRAVIVAEDSTFFLHNGIEIEEIQRAIQDGLTSGKKTRGGSTLTQQLVKNLFLTRDRTALRKIQEALLTFHIESALKKEKIFEIYMNVIEWGPDVYGLKEAAWHYFGRSPEALSPKEMAYLATIIPGPILFHEHYENGYVPASHEAKVNTLLERLNRLGSLPDDELEKAIASKIHFARRR